MGETQRDMCIGCKAEPSVDDDEGWSGTMCDACRKEGNEIREFINSPKGDPHLLNMRQLELLRIWNAYTVATSLLRSGMCDNSITAIGIVNSLEITCIVQHDRYTLMEGLTF